MRLAAVTMLVALVAALGPAGAAVQPDPLEGLWRHAGGTVLVERSGDRWTGVVRDRLVLHQCPHRAGERIWTIVKTKRGYAGRHLGFGARPGCGLRVWLSANWQAGPRTLQLWVARFEGQWPRACGDLTLCYRFTRVGPPPKPAPAAPAPPPAPTLTITLAGTPASGAAALGAGYLSSTASGRLTTGSGSLLLVHTFADRVELTVLEAVAVRRTSTGATATVRVGRSETAGCEAGGEGTVVARGGDDVTVRVCGWSLRWSGERVAARLT